MVFEVWEMWYCALWTRVMPWLINSRAQFETLLCSILSWLTIILEKPLSQFSCVCAIKSWMQMISTRILFSCWQSAACHVLWPNNILLVAVLRIRICTNQWAQKALKNVCCKNGHSSHNVIYMFTCLCLQPNWTTRIHTTISPITTWGIHGCPHCPASLWFCLWLRSSSPWPWVPSLNVLGRQHTLLCLRFPQGIQFMFYYHSMKLVFSSGFTMKT